MIQSIIPKDRLFVENWWSLPIAKLLLTTNSSLMILNRPELTIKKLFGSCPSRSTISPSLNFFTSTRFARGIRLKRSLYLKEKTQNKKWFVTFILINKHLPQRMRGIIIILTLNPVLFGLTQVRSSWNNPSKLWRESCVHKSR